MNYQKKSAIYLCCQYALPPNLLHLCGPEKQNDLSYYATTGIIDQGTAEILSQFTTLFPYLKLIAYGNNITDPYDRRVVEAYFLGNRLLDNVSIRQLASYFSDTLDLKKKLEKKALNKLLEKIPQGALPYHAFHVLNVYKRTGHIDSPHTLSSMDACIVNWGKVKNISPTHLTVETKPLVLKSKGLRFGDLLDREILLPEESDVKHEKIKLADVISYHWGMFCDKLTSKQLNNLIFYTNLSLKLANLS